MRLLLKRKNFFINRILYSSLTLNKYTLYKRLSSELYNIHIFEIHRNQYKLYIVPPEISKLITLTAKPRAFIIYIRKLEYDLDVSRNNT